MVCSGHEVRGVCRSNGKWISQLAGLAWRVRRPRKRGVPGGNSIRRLAGLARRMKQPLLPAAVLYAGGILAGAMAPVSPWVLLGVCLGLAGVALGWGRGRATLLCLLVFLAGWTNLSLHTAVLSPNDLRRILGDQPAIVSVRGALRETPSLRAHRRGQKESWRAIAQVEATALSTNHQPWQPATGRIAVTTPGTLGHFFGGQTVEISGVAAPPKGAEAEGTFDYRAYLKEMGIYYQLQAASEKDWIVLARPPAPPLADRFRTWARRALGRGLPLEDESLRLEWALTLGWKAALTEEVSEPFIQAATYHIFAVDGLRMAIVFGIFFGLFRALGLPRPWSGAVLIPLIWFYVALTGWPASAIRATVMLSVVIVGWVLKRPSDLLNSLFVAALIILAWEPSQLFQAGFQLSFLVVLCILLLLPPLRRWAERLTAPDPMLPEALLPRWRRLATRAGALRRRPFAHLICRVGRLAAAGGLLFSYRDAREHAGQHRGRAAVRPGLGQQPGLSVSGGLVSGGGGMLQPRRLVSDGVHPRKQPLVCPVAGRLSLRGRARHFWQRPLLRPVACSRHGLALPAQRAFV